MLQRQADLTCSAAGLPLQFFFTLAPAPQCDGEADARVMCAHAAWWLPTSHPLSLLAIATNTALFFLLAQASMWCWGA